MIKVNPKASFLSGIALLTVMTTAVQAADDSYSFYVKPSLGYTMPENVDIVDDVNVSTPDVDTENAASYAIAMGAHDVFVPRLGFEVEYAKRGFDIDGSSTTTFPAGVVPFAPNGLSTASQVTGDVDIESLMLNVSYSFPVTEKLSLFVQGGVGVADVDVGTLSFNTTHVPGSSNVETAFSYGAGFNYQVTDRMKIEMLYRRLDLGSVETDPSPFLNDAGIFLGKDHFDVKMDEVTLGLKYTF